MDLGFSPSGQASDLNSGTRLATLANAWHYSASASTGWPGVSLL